MVFSFLGILLLAAATAGQNPLPSGNLYGTVLDEEGRSVPGVSAAVRGPGAPQRTITDVHGDFHFLDLSPGSYSLTLERAGFATVRREDVLVSLGKNTVLRETMGVATAEEAVTVSAESALPDSRKTETGATFERRELDTIPTTRDPWAILRQVPGVLVRNMNVSGSESATQSDFVGKGSHSDQNTFNLDGVAITGIGGATPLFFDFDSLQEIEIATGGSNPALATPGVSLNLVTKRGTNELRGSARALHSGAGWDYGLEAGGPLWKDHLWLWGAGARNDVPGQTFILEETGEPVRQKPRLEQWNAKLNAQLASENSMTFFYVSSNKVIEGLGAAFGNRTQESAWNQGLLTKAYKVEDAHVFSDKLFASIYFSYLSSDFTLTPQGGTDKQADLDANGIWHNSYGYYPRRSPQHQVGLTGSAFFDTGDLRHELKFGFGYRHTTSDSLSAWPGDGLIGNEFSQSVGMTREAITKHEVNYTDVFLADTLQRGNLTVNAGIRFDYQRSRNLPSAVRANPVFPDLLPAVQYEGDSGYPITWTLLQPRVGATYALGRDRKTLIRASYSRFSSRLGGEAFVINAFPGPAYIYYGWNDPNGDHRVEPNEVDLSPSNFLFASNVDPNNPGSTASVNRIARGLKPPTTDELIFGVERELLPDLSASIAYTRRSSKNLEFSPLVGTTRADYQYLGNASGSVTANGFTLDFNEPYYGLTTSPPPAGSEVRNRPDYRESYGGLELQVIKRLSHHWMVRASFSYNDWRSHVGHGAIVDPNNLLGGSNESGAVLQALCATPACPRATVFINSKWQFNVSGIVQLPFGVAAGMNLFGRQGFAVPYFIAVVAHDQTGPFRQIQIGRVDAHRLSDVYELDLHVEKVVRLGSKVAVSPSLDCFNAANSHTVLTRVGRVGSWDSEREPAFRPGSDFNQAIEVLSDRTFRAGVRISF